MIESARADNKKREWVFDGPQGTITFPYAKCDPEPTASDRVQTYFIDDELAREAVTYVLKSGREGFVHIDMALDYHRDPGYMRELILHQLTVDALTVFRASGLSKRELIRRLKTSSAQLYRLLDPANYSKSVDSMLELLGVLGCDVEFSVHQRSA